MVHYKRKKARKQQNYFGLYKEITKCRSGGSFFPAAFFKERSVYIILILTHLHLHGGRISRKLLSPEVVKEEKNTGSKSNGIGNFKYRKSTGDISGGFPACGLPPCYTDPGGLSTGCGKRYGCNCRRSPQSVGSAVPPLFA